MTTRAGGNHRSALAFIARCQLWEHGHARWRQVQLFRPAETAGSTNRGGLRETRCAAQGSGPARVDDSQQDERRRPEDRLRRWQTHQQGAGSQRRAPRRALGGRALGICEEGGATPNAPRLETPRTDVISRDRAASRGVVRERRRTSVRAQDPTTPEPPVPPPGQPEPEFPPPAPPEPEILPPPGEPPGPTPPPARDPPWAGVRESIPATARTMVTHPRNSQ